MKNQKLLNTTIKIGDATTLIVVPQNNTIPTPIKFLMPTHPSMMPQAIVVAEKGFNANASCIIKEVSDPIEIDVILQQQYNTDCSVELTSIVTQYKEQQQISDVVFTMKSPANLVKPGTHINQTLSLGQDNPIMSLQNSADFELIQGKLAMQYLGEQKTLEDLD